MFRPIKDRSLKVRRFTQEEKDEIFSLYMDGVKRAAIAKQVGCSENAVSYVIHRFSHPVAPKPSDWKSEEIEGVIAQYKSGKSFAQIGAEYDRHPTNIRTVLKKSGVPLRTKSESMVIARAAIEARRFEEFGVRKRIGRDGYVRVLSRNHPAANGRYVLEHRLVMESHLKATTPNHAALARGYLSSRWVVHHINRKKADNRIENLMLVNPSDHKLIHGSAALYLKKANNEILEKDARILELEHLVSELKEQSVYAV